MVAKILLILDKWFLLKKPLSYVCVIKGKSVLRPNIRLTHFPILILRGAIYREGEAGLENCSDPSEQWSPVEITPFPNRNVCSS